MTAQVTRTETDLIDAALDDLATGEKRWRDLTLGGRRQLLESLLRTVSDHAQEWVTAAAAYKSLPAGSTLIGEEWLSGPYAVLTALHALIETLRKLEHGGSPIDGCPVSTAPGGRIAVQALPHGVFDTLLLNGFRAQVWLEPGVTLEQARARAGLGQRTPTRTGGIGAVLGAGNISSIPPLDVLTELLAHNRVSVLKLNPVTETIRPVFERAFAPLIAPGFLRIVTGGVETGQYLVHHSAVSHVHITGSAASHDAIVFGPGIEGAARRAATAAGAAEPLLDKPISSELGGVSPIIVVPGRWSTADLKFQAEHIATQRLHNGGYNCIAGQAVVISADWPQRAAFLAALRTALTVAPPRSAYYPGSDQRIAAARDGYPAAQSLPGGRLLLTDVPLKSDEKALTTEYFAPVLAVTELPGAGPAFLQAAVQAVNQNFAGTLGVNVIVHPRTLRSAGPAFDRMLAELRYGCIAVNTWTGLGFLTARATWGAFPGHSLSDVQSGIGLVHNALLLDQAERTVVRGPFRPAHRALGAGEFTLSPKPPWFVSNRTQDVTARRLTAFAAKPGWARLPAIFASALRG